MAPSEEKEIQDLIADDSQLIEQEVWTIEQFLRYPEFVIDTNDEAPVEEQLPSENDENSQDPLENRKTTLDWGDQDTDMTGVSDDETLELAEGPVKDQDLVADESQLLDEEVWSIEQFHRFPEFVVGTNDEAPVGEQVPSSNDEDSQDPPENPESASNGGDQDANMKGVSDDEILELGEGPVKEWNDEKFWAALSKWEYLDHVLEANQSRLSGEEIAMETPIEAGAGESEAGPEESELEAKESEAEEPQSEVCFGDY